MDDQGDLSRRERQIMNVIYSLGEATAIQVVENLTDPPSRTAVRTMLGILVEKKLLTYSKRGREYIYSPTRSAKKAGRSAFKHLVDTFFGGSVEEALASHLADPKNKLDSDDLKRLEKIVRAARRENKS